MGNIKWLRKGLITILIVVIGLGYGGVCSKDDQPVASGSSGSPGFVGTAEDIRQWKEIIRDKVPSSNKAIALQTNHLLPSSGEWALSFDGIDDYVEVQDSESLDITGSITLETWLKPSAVSESPDWRAVIYKLGTGGAHGIKGGYGFLVTGNQTQIYFFTGSAGVCFAGADLTLGEWNHVVGTYDDTEGETKGNIAIYINGALKDSGNFPGYAPWDTDRPLLFGGNRFDDGFAPYEFDGLIDGVAIYSRALDAIEVLPHYQQGIPNNPYPTDIVSYWPLEEGAGNIAGDVIAANGNHGTILPSSPNGATWVELDPTPPVITINAPINGATYILTAVVNVNVTIVDPESGIASQEIKLNGSSINQGDAINISALTNVQNSLTVKAVNGVGKEATASSIFYVNVSPSSIGTIVNQGIQSGQIQNVGTSLQTKLNTISSSIDAGNTLSAAHEINSFINAVQGAKTAGNITAAVADQLIRWANELKSQLPSPTPPTATVNVEIVIGPLDYVGTGADNVKETWVKLRTKTGNTTPNDIAVQCNLTVEAVNKNNANAGTATVSPSTVTLEILAGQCESDPVTVRITGTRESTAIDDTQLIAAGTPTTGKTTVEQGQAKEEFTVISIDLEIYNGLKDWVNPQDNWSGGQFIPEVKEAGNENTVGNGAFTVANLNDTNSNNKPDNHPDETVVTGEKDLMQIILKKPIPDFGGSVTFKVVSDRVIIWAKSTKEVLITGPNSQLQIPTSALPKTWYVEGIQQSASRRDVKLTLEYRGIEDIVNATLIWADITQDANGFRNTDQGPGRDANDSDYITTFNTGTNGNLGLVNPPNHAVNAMEMEFTVYPEKIGNESGVKFDVTRQAQGKWWDDGAENVGMRRYFPAKDELPNDDGLQGDEDNDPKNNHIYSCDKPGWPTATAHLSESVMRYNFYEFVRVRLDGTQPAGEVTVGSRCSPKIAWRALLALVGPPGANWTRLNRIASATTPVPDPNNTGNGQIVFIQTDNDATVSEDWAITYAGANKWNVQGSKTLAHAQASTDVAYTSNNTEIRFTIQAGTTPFAVGDKFTLATKGARINEIELGHRPIPFGP